MYLYPFQWLVKRSMEMREETADFLRSFAIAQFEKQHTKDSNDETDSSADNLVSNIRLAKVNK